MPDAARLDLQGTGTRTGAAKLDCGRHAQWPSLMHLSWSPSYDAWTWHGGYMAAHMVTTVAPASHCRTVAGGNAGVMHLLATSW